MSLVIEKTRGATDGYQGSGVEFTVKPAQTNRPRGGLGSGPVVGSVAAAAAAAATSTAGPGMSTRPGNNVPASQQPPPPGKTDYRDTRPFLKTYGVRPMLFYREAPPPMPVRRW